VSKREEDQARRWMDRIDGARSVWEDRKQVSDQLERALDGDFPGLIPGTTDETARKLRLRGDDQINVNLLLRAATYMVALAYDEFPSLRFSREPGDDDDVVVAATRLIEKLMDEGGAIYESRDAMMSSFTRGPWAVWLSVEKDLISTAELNASTIPPASFVDAALAGEVPDVPDGVDFQAVGEAARAITENPDLALGLTAVQIDALNALAEQAEVKYAKSLDEPTNQRIRSKIVYDFTAYGTRLLWDASVTDVRHASWMARRIKMNRWEFEREPMFKRSAVKKVLDTLDDEERKAADNQASSKPVEDYAQAGYVGSGDVWVWEVHDKINRKRHYLCESCDEFLEKDDEHPWLDEYGRPLFAGFYPCVVRVPIKTPRECAERAVGLPWLEIGWPLAVEFIKLRSAAVIAAKKSARIGILSAGMPDDSAAQLESASDGTFIKLGSGYDRNRDGDPITNVEFGGMPMDYLTASKVVQSDFASMMGLSLASMTSEPVADTLGQEQIALQGANTTQGDMVRQFESGFAELAMMTLKAFRMYATPEECAAYLGKSALEPRQHPDGSPRPSVYEAFKTMDVTGCKLVCRFASGTRADDAVYVKQLQDFIALSSTLRDNTNTPYFDVRPLMERLGKAMDIEGLKPYEPTAAELAQIMAAQLAPMMEQGGEGAPDQGGKGERETPGGGRSDGRRAGGQRGPAPVPGRQSRNRAPATAQNMGGQAQRPRTATA